MTRLFSPTSWISVLELGPSSSTSRSVSSVALGALADSSVNLEVRVWVRHAAERQPTYVTVMEASKLALDKAGIQIPFPHLQLFVDDVEDRVIEKVGGIGRGPSA